MFSFSRISTDWSQNPDFLHEWSARSTTSRMFIEPVQNEATSSLPLSWLRSPHLAALGLLAGSAPDTDLCCFCEETGGTKFFLFLLELSNLGNGKLHSLRTAVNIFFGREWETGKNSKYVAFLLEFPGTRQLCATHKECRFSVKDAADWRGALLIGQLEKRVEWLNEVAIPWLREIYWK